MTYSQTLKDELTLMAQADARARTYLEGIDTRAPFPDQSARDGRSIFDEAIPDQGKDASETLSLLDDYGSIATTASNGPRYFGFVIDAALPAAAACERLMLAWDQCASSYDNSPVAATIESITARWLLEILDLPRESAVGFGTSATSCTLSCLSAARMELLARQGWDINEQGRNGAPPIRIVIPQTVHITVTKALRLLGFGAKDMIVAPTDAFGRVDPERLPELDAGTILCLQAGEVNTGEFDPFVPLMNAANKAGAWVHVDGAFGLWARASTRRHLTEGVEKADSWTTDGHKWLNTPYDGAIAICKNPEALAKAMNADAVYASASKFAQKNLTVEFSRRARGIPIWAALRTLGRDGVSQLIDAHSDEAHWLASQLKTAGFELLNRVQLNQILLRCETDELTAAVRQNVLDSGAGWFGMSVWEDRPAFRISLSSFRTEHIHVEELANALKTALQQCRGST